VEGLAILWQHKSWDVGVTYKRVGTYYNDNATLSYKINGLTVPYPVNQAVTIKPFELTNLFVNYTIKNASRLRGSKIQFGLNNLTDSHNLVGITPATAPTATTPFVAAPGDLLNLLPGRSFSISITGGYASRR
jgi:iron complex outermembrane receptor protein